MNAVYLEVGINQTMENWTTVFLTSKLEAGWEYFPHKEQKHWTIINEQ